MNLFVFFCLAYSLLHIVVAQMRSDMKLRRNKILNFFTISLLAGYCLNADIAFASNSDACPHLDINESTNICEQNARHLALENN